MRTSRHIGLWLLFALGLGILVFVTMVRQGSSSSKGAEEKADQAQSRLANPVDKVGDTAKGQASSQSAPPGNVAGRNGSSPAVASSATSSLPPGTTVEIQKTKSKYPFVRIERRGDSGPVVAMVADHLIVSMGEQTPAEVLQKRLSATGLVLRKTVAPGRVYLLSSEGESQPDKDTLDRIRARLRPLEGTISHAEPDFVVTHDRVPNDPGYSALWGMNNTSPPTGSEGDIDAPEAWDLATDASSVVVGIIDTGIDYAHPDLAANVWTNAGEIVGNGVDDDGNGYVDDVHGYDFYNGDGNPMDDHYHGTHVAGTIGAAGDNGVGVVGVAWRVKLMALKFLSSSGDGYTSDAVAAVNYATQNGAKFTSNSWGGGGYSSALFTAIQNSGSVFVAAAGNDGLDTDKFPSYPASYNLPNIISVAATDRDDRLASFSNHGATTVDIAAPGVSIYSTSPSSGYRYLSGTSMATPHVSGACALLFGRDASLTPAEVKTHLMNSASRVGSLAGKVVSGARLDARSLIEGYNTEPPVITSASSVVAYAGVGFQFQVAADHSPVWFEATGLPQGLKIDRATGKISGVATVLGVSHVALAAGNAAGAGTSTLQLTVAIEPPHITSSLVKAGVVGSALAYQITASPPATSFGATGLPAGLMFDQSTGVISGAPLTAGVYPVGLSATNAGGTDSKVLTLTISPRPPPEITSPLSMTGRYATAFSYQITATNSPTNYGASGLPSGLSVNTGNGLISGTPAVAGSFAVTITASNESGSDSETLQLLINPPNAPEITSGLTASGRVGEVFSFQITATNNPTGFAASGLPAGLAVNATSGLVSGVPTASGNFAVLVRANNPGGEGSAVVSMTILPPVPVVTSPAAVTARAGEALRYQITSQPAADVFGASGLPTGLTLNGTSGEISGVVEQEGTYAVTVTATGAGGTGSLGVTVTIQPRPIPEITSPTSISGSYATAFSYQITANHAPTSFGASGLPAGLAVKTASGLISGRPTEVGTFAVTITATNESGSGSKTLAMVINPPDVPRITSPGTAAGQVGQNFSYGITASNHPTAFGADGLPAGLTVNTGTGSISGTPTASGTFAVLVKASNLGGEGSAVVNLTILPPAPVITSGTTISARVDEAIRYHITSEPEAQSYGASGLPADLTLNGVSGEISGHVEQVGSYPVILSATGTGGTGTLAVMLTILPRPPPEITSPLSISGKYGKAFNYQITATHKPASYGAASLPAGLTINPGSGVISGTPTEVGSFGVAITATNESGSDSETLALVIHPPDAPVITSPGTASGQVGQVFSYIIAASNAPTAFAAEGLPGGLSVNSGSGLVSGTPTASGSFAVVVKASNLGGEASAVVNVTILPPAPMITSGATITAHVNEQIAYQVTSEPEAHSFGASGLPAGLTLNVATGELRGTVGQVGSYPVTLTATGAGGTGSLGLTVHILPNPPVLAPVGTLSFEVGEPVDFQFSASNQPTQFTVDGLPSGLVLDGASGRVTGLASAQGTFPLTIGASNAGGSNTLAATLEIVIGPTRIISFTPTTINPHEIITIHGVGFQSTRGVYFSHNNHEWIDAEAFQVVSDSELRVTVPYVLQNSSQKSNLIVESDQGLAVVFPTNTIDVTAGHDAGHASDAHFVVKRGGAWIGDGFANRVVVEEGGSARAMGGSVNTFFVRSGGFLDLSYSTISNSNQVFHAEDAIVLQNVGVTAIGRGDFRVVNNIRVTKLPTLLEVRQVPLIVSANSGTAAVGDRFEYQLLVSRPYPQPTFAATSLPHGLALDAVTGKLSGYPSTPGVYSIPFTITNPAGSAAFVYTLTVTGTPVPVMHGPTRIEASSTASLSFQVEIYNGPATFAATGLPPGLSIHPTTGVVSGLPTGSGFFAATISATNSFGTASRAFSVYVDEVPLSIASYDPDSAANATWVTVQGTGFDLVREVYFVNEAFDPVAASAFTIVSETELRVQLPDLNFQGTSGSPIILKGEGYSCMALPNGKGIVVESGQAVEISGTAYKEFFYVRSGGTLSSGRFGFNNAVFLEEGAHLDLIDQFPVKAVFKSGTATVTGVVQPRTQVVEMTSLSLNRVTDPLLNVYRLPQVYSGDQAGNVGDFFHYEIVTQNFSFTSYQATGLPPGLKLAWVQAPGGAFIGGVPEVAGDYQVKITLRDSAGHTGEKTVGMAISNAPRARMTSAGRLDVVAGQAIDHQITASHTPTGFSSSNLPPGVTLSNYGRLTGSIASPGVWKVPVQIQNIHGTSTSILLLAVGTALPQVTQMPATTTRLAEFLLTGNSLQTVNRVYFVRDYWSGVQGTVLQSSVASVRVVTPDSSSLSSSGMPLLVDGAGGASVVGRDNAMRVARAGTVNTPSNGGSVWYVESGATLLFRGSAPSVIFAENGSYVDLTGAYTAPTVIHAPNAVLAGGGNAVFIPVNDLGRSILPNNLSVLPLPTLAVPTAYRAYLGVPFLSTITAWGGSISAYGASGLPTGLSLNTNSGSIFGTPTQTGDFNVSVSATNSHGTSSKQVTMRVGDPVDFWRDQTFAGLEDGGDNPLAGDMVDADGDGIFNLLEFAGGLDPLQRDNRPPLFESARVSNGNCEYTFRRRKGSGSGDPVNGYEVDGIRYTTEISHDLVEWHSGPAYLENVGTPVDNADGTESVTVHPKATAPARTTSFIRVKVERVN
jgi:subtilisin family serine protease/PKD repeat protein